MLFLSFLIPGKNLYTNEYVAIKLVSALLLLLLDFSHLQMIFRINFNAKVITFKSLHYVKKVQYGN